MTGGYEGLHLFRRDYRGLQGITRGYKRLQGARRGYRGLQGVTKGYRRLRSFSEEEFFLDSFRKRDVLQLGSSLQLHFFFAFTTCKRLPGASWAVPVWKRTTTTFSKKSTKILCRFSEVHYTELLNLSAIRFRLPPVLGHNRLNRYLPFDM